MQLDDDGNVDDDSMEWGVRFKSRGPVPLRVNGSWGGQNLAYP